MHFPFLPCAPRVPSHAASASVPATSLRRAMFWHADRPLLVVLALTPVHILSGLTFHVLQLIVIKSVLDNLVSELCESRASVVFRTTWCFISLTSSRSGNVSWVVIFSGALLAVNSDVHRTNRVLSAPYVSSVEVDFLRSSTVGCKHAAV